MVVRRIAHGRETYVIPFDNIRYSLPSSSANFGPATLILTDLQLTDLETRAPTSNRRKQPNRWRRTWPNTFNHATPTTDPTSQQRILELETELAKVKASHLIHQEPPTQLACHQFNEHYMETPPLLLVAPGFVNTWLEESQPPCDLDVTFPTPTSFQSGKQFTSPHRQFFHLTFSIHAQLHCETAIPTHSSSFSAQPGSR